jgi:hypothetical protein
VHGVGSCSRMSCDRMRLARGGWRLLRLLWGPEPSELRPHQPARESARLGCRSRKHTVSCKLPHTHALALELDNAHQGFHTTGYESATLKPGPNSTLTPKPNSLRPHCRHERVAKGSARCELPARSAGGDAERAAGHHTHREHRSSRILQGRHPRTLGFVVALRTRGEHGSPAARSHACAAHAVPVRRRPMSNRGAGGAAGRGGAGATAAGDAAEAPVTPGASG